MKERKGEVGDELKRVAQHPGKFVNCSVWNAGVMQRMLTVDLYRHLTNEHKTLKLVVADLDSQITATNERIIVLNKKSQVLGAQVTHLTRLKDEVRRCYQQAAKKTIMEELRAELKSEAEAQEKKMQEEQVSGLVRRVPTRNVNI